MTSASVDGDGGLPARRHAVDVAGALILASFAVWALVTAAARNGRPEGVLLAVLALAAGYAYGRIGGAVLPVGACFVVAVAGLGAAVSSASSSSGPAGSEALGMPTAAQLGHTSPVAALLVLSVGAACCGAWVTERPGVRVGLRLFALGTVLMAAVLGSTAGLVGCTAVLLCSLAAARTPHRGPGLIGLGGTVSLVVGAMWAVASAGLPDGLARAFGGELSVHRLGLWQDAVDLTRRDPALGVGPGRYGEFSGAAHQALHSDARPHSAPLQLAAEQGVFGFLLLAAAFCWLLYALWRSPGSTQLALTAGAALAAVAVLASVGSALSFTSVTAGVGILAGLATSRPWRDDTPQLDPPDTTGEPLRIRP